VYTAQAVADFCEVDLKTVHHWADRGKVPHFRTEGRHLRFRRNDVVRFLRAHGYPLPDALVRARPTIALALAPSSFEGTALTLDDFAKRLGSRFVVRRHASAAVALAHLLADAPDALVVAHDDATLGFPSAVSALKADPALSWIVIAVVAEDDLLEAVRAAGADVAIAGRDVAKLSGELARTLAVS
jgi:excisionase family DNA binding protein